MQFLYKKEPSQGGVMARPFYYTNNWGLRFISAYNSPIIGRRNMGIN